MRPRSQGDWTPVAGFKFLSADHYTTGPRKYSRKTFMKIEFIMELFYRIIIVGHGGIINLDDLEKSTGF